MANRVVLVVVAENLAIPLGIDVLHRPAARIDNRVGLVRQLGAIARGVAVAVIAYDIGLAQRIDPLAAGAIRQIEDIGQAPAEAQRIGVLHLVHSPQRVVVVFCIGMSGVVWREDGV